MNPNPKQRSRGRGNNGGNPNRTNHGGHSGGGGHSGNSGGGGHSGNRNINVRSQVFDSNGPEGRIRGNAHQVMEKYLTLARDASLQGDRHMAENFYQHAEHYFRLINAFNQNNGQRRPPMSTPAGDQAEMTGEDDEQGDRRYENQESGEGSPMVEAAELSRAADTGPMDEQPQQQPPPPPQQQQQRAPRAPRVQHTQDGEMDGPRPPRMDVSRGEARAEASRRPALRSAAEPAAPMAAEHAVLIAAEPAPAAPIAAAPAAPVAADPASAPQPEIVEAAAAEDGVAPARKPVGRPRGRRRAAPAEAEATDAAGDAEPVLI